MTGSILNWVAGLWNRQPACKNLLPYERLVFDAWRSSLQQESRRILDAQIEAVSFVQHQAGGAKVCFFYRENGEVPLFKLDRPDLHAATVLLRAEGVATLRAKIFLHRGKFFSIEFPKRPSRFMKQHGIEEQALQVANVESHIAVA